MLSFAEHVDKVSIIEVDEGGFGYEDQDKLAEASTNDEGYVVEAAHYVKGTCEGGADDCEKYFEGTFEDGKDYYVMIHVYSKPGFKFTTASLDNVKINGSAPAEIFNVYPNGIDGTRTMFLAKIKATNTPASTETTTSKGKNVKTGDNVMLFVILLSASALGIVSMEVIKRRKVKNN